MINKKNWQLTRKYLEYRLRVDQITKGSLKKEETHIRYVLNWAQEYSFQQVMVLRPTLPEYLLSARLDGCDGQLSAVYLKKMLATARYFFSWLSDNQIGYRTIRNNWIQTLKIKRLSDIPKNREAVTLEEIFIIAASPARTITERRARAALVFLFLSGMRIGAFVTLPLRAVNISERKIIQYSSLGVRTKNNKNAITYLLDIPELLAVVQEWDDEIRTILPPSGYWFAPLSPETGEIDNTVVSVGEHRSTLARRGMKEYQNSVGLSYHSPHKFRHGFVQYGAAHSRNIAEYKAVSMNVMHSSMKITDEFYSNLDDGEIKNRITALSNQKEDKEADELARYKRFLEWEKQQGIH